MGSCYEHTLFNRLFPGPVQCQRALCTTSCYIEAQCEHSLEMRAPIHIQTLVLPPDRGVYCARFQQWKHFARHTGNKFVPCWRVCCSKQNFTQEILTMISNIRSCTLLFPDSNCRWANKKVVVIFSLLRIWNSSNLLHCLPTVWADV